MTVIRPNSVSGITSITAQANEINVFRSNGLLAGLNLNGVNFNTTAGISTLAALKITGNLDVEGVLTYQDVTNVDSLGIITARSNIDCNGNLDVDGQTDLDVLNVSDTATFSGRVTVATHTHFNFGSNNDNYITQGSSGNTYFRTAATLFLQINNSGHLLPYTDSTFDLGTSSKRFRNFYADTLYGDGSNLTGISGVTINNNADNRVITGSGTAATLNAESTLTYDGTNLDLGDGKYVRLGANNDFQMWHNGGTGNTNIKQVTGSVYFYTGSDLNMLIKDGTSVDLYYANSKEFQTTSYGISIGNDAAGSISGQAGIEIGKGHTTSELRLKNTSGGSGQGDGFGIQKWSDGNTYIYEYDPHNFVIGTNGASRWIIGGTSGHITPFSNNTYDIGSSSSRVRNIYTNDLNLSNKGSTNSVDNTWGDYTIQEGESDLFLINNRNGKKYKFNLTEVE